jgi:hypothetical protein
MTKDAYWTKKIFFPTLGAQDVIFFCNFGCNFWGLLGHSTPKKTIDGAVKI